MPQLNNKYNNTVWIIREIVHENYILPITVKESQGLAFFRFKEDKGPLPVR